MYVSIPQIYVVKRNNDWAVKMYHVAPLESNGHFDGFCLGRAEHSSINSYIFDLVQQYKSMSFPSQGRSSTH